MIPRTVSSYLRSIFTKYPVVTITGPRQSGKTTLCRQVFSKKPYANLESFEVRDFAKSDPKRFLGQFPDGAVLDEIQRAPELVSFIQVHVDEKKRNGLFILTGSQQFEISQAISQSLAGRTAIIKLLPLSLEEVSALGASISADEALFKGFYPRIHDQDLNPTQALGDYFETYVQRDLRQLSEVRHLSIFEKFVKLCSGRIGQLLQLQGLGSDAGVSHTTAREWISLLEASFIVFLLNPFFGNISKRLIKSPKLYFYDVGLACYLLGIENQKQLLSHPLRGQLFENLIIGEALKFRYNRGQKNNLHFLRDSSGNEIDLLLDFGQQVLPIEIKAGQTIAGDFFKGFQAFEDFFKKSAFGRLLVYAGKEKQDRGDVRVAGFLDFHRSLEDLLKNV